MGVRTGKELCVQCVQQHPFQLEYGGVLRLFQNLIYSECMSGVSAVAVYKPLKATKIDDNLATIMITIAQQNEFMLFFR